MSTSHFVMFCSLKWILMPAGMSAMHSPYSCVVSVCLRRRHKVAG